MTRCWNLKELNRQYARFLRKWVPEWRRYGRRAPSSNGLSPSECFVHRFWVIHEYSAFPGRDPNLPAELLPKGWMGNEASQVFREYRGKLAKRADTFVDETLRTANGIGTENPVSS
ncbi:MAG: hypothetical protein LAQ69_17655 [Acidobacteriia bacterium]|nr:hypothetical protein [Terriglobia bacterium]